MLIALDIKNEERLLSNQTHLKEEELQATPNLDTKNDIIISYDLHQEVKCVQTGLQFKAFIWENKRQKKRVQVEAISHCSAKCI